MYIPKKTRQTKPNLDVFTDTETYQTKIIHKGEEKTIIRPFLIGWWCEGEFYYSIEPHTTFFNFMIEKCKTHSVSVWFYNAGYDIPVIMPEYLTKLDSDFKCVYKVSDSKNLIDFSYKSQQLSFVIKDAALWNPHIKGLDEYLTKIDPNFRKVEGYHYERNDLILKDGIFYFTDNQGNQLTSSLKDDLHYLKRDVEGLSRVVASQREEQDVIYEALKIKHRFRIYKPTSASFGKYVINCILGFNYFDNTFRNLIKGEYALDVYKTYIQSSCGGFTCASDLATSVYEPDQKIKSYDVNSMYPFVVSLGLPKGLPSNKNLWGKNSIKWYECFMNKCEWKEKYKHMTTKPFPQKWCDDNLYFFVTAEYYHLNIDKVETDIEIIKTHYQEMDTSLTPLTLTLYEIKRKAKEEGNKTLEKSVKLILNCMYGKACERTYLEETFYNPVICNFINNTPLITEFKNPLAGVYIAQKARTYLLKSIYKEIDNGNVFLYSDTDSIKLIENVPVSLPIHKDKLGYYKCEACCKENEGYTHFLNNGKSKKYFMYNENYNSMNTMQLTISGVSNAVKRSIEEKGTFELYVKMFNPNNNFLIVNGKLDKTRNHWGQLIFSSINIAFNEMGDGVATHNMRFDKESKKWVVTAFNKQTNEWEFDC